MGEGNHLETAILLGGSILECFIAAGELDREARESSAEEHCHASHELLLCQGGTGFQFANGTAYGYREDTVFLLPAHVRHASILDRGAKERRTSVRFLNSRWDRSAGPGEVEGILSTLRETGCIRLPLDAGTAAALEALRDAAGHGHGLEAEGQLAALFARVFQLCRQDANGGAALGDEGRRKFLMDHYFDRIADSGEEPGRLNELCAQLYLSPSQLNRFLKETYGVTFKQRAIDVRLAKIKYYLRCTDLTAAEVARRMNFPTDSSFSLFFKQHEGMSPTQFRRLGRGEGDGGRSA